MLLFGPALVAHDASRTAPVTPYGGTTISGKQVFLANCGSCHTLAAAGTTGQLGPNLDQVSLTASHIANQVRQGGGSMPAFANKLSGAEIQAVAALVARGH
jgi:mono/diheme cytochrome c family protein